MQSDNRLEAQSRQRLIDAVAEAYQYPVARLRRADGAVVGAGFLAPRGVVVTCAHVVNDALGRKPLSIERPNQPVALDFPWAVSGHFVGTVIDWRPPVAPGSRDGEACADIAVLRLDGLSPVESAVRPQSPISVPEDTTFRVMGFPDGADAGAPARGSVRGTDSGGWHHVEADHSYGRTIAPGFSGAPAIGDRPGNLLLGMIDISDPDERRGVLIPVSALMRAWPPLAEPFRGLEAFREEDAAYFFGREIFATQLWNSFQRHTLTLLTGPSGVGKSSLINAGFLPRLRETKGWRVVRFRPGDRPIAHLARELVGALRPDSDPLTLADEAQKREKMLLENPSRLRDYGDACQQATGFGLCIIIDQFEETFTLAQAANPDQHRALVAALSCLSCQSNPSVKAVLGLRSDFQTLFQSDEAAATLIDAVSGAPTVLLRAMTAAERERIILGPIDPTRLDVKLDDGLLGRILDDIAHNPDALPLLEFALAELWHRMDIDEEHRRMTLAAYIEIDGVAGALAGQADRIINDMKLEERQVKQLLTELVRVAETAEQDARRPRTKAELDAIAPDLWRMAQRLAQTRLLVATDEPAVDIVHEALFRRWTRLRDWIEEERDFLRWRQRLEERRREWEQDAGPLLTGRALEDGERWLARRGEAVIPQQRRFVEASVEARRRQDVKDHVDRLWNRLELNSRRLNEDEYRALMELQRASPEVRHAFLLSAVIDEPRARRFCRGSSVAMRAAFGFDSEQAKAFVAKLWPMFDIEIWLSEPKRIQAALRMGLEIALVERFDSSTAQRVIEQVSAAVAKTSDLDQLRIYAEALNATARFADPATAHRTIERVSAVISETDDGNQLWIYAGVVKALDGFADTAIARRIIEKGSRNIGKIAERDWKIGEYAQIANAVGQEAAYSWVVRTLVGFADQETARRTIEQAVAALTKASSLLYIGNPFEAWVGVIKTLAALADAATLQRVLERVSAHIVEADNSDKLEACSEIIEALAGIADAATAQRIIEQMLAAVTRSRLVHKQLTYAITVKALAKAVDAATTQRIIERASACIEDAVVEQQVIGAGQIINALAGLTYAANAQRLIKQAWDGLTKALTPATREIRISHERRFGKFVETIKALARFAEAETAQELIEQASVGMIETTGRDELIACAEVIKALAGFANAATAERLIDHASAGIVNTIDVDFLILYCEVIETLATSAKPETAQRVIEQLVAATMNTLNKSLLEAYVKALKALAPSADAATAQRVIEQISAAFARTVDADQQIGYANVIESLAGFIDAPTGKLVIERVSACITKTIDEGRLIAFAKTVKALAWSADAGTQHAAAAYLGRAITITAETGDYNVFSNVADAIVVIQGALPRDAWLLAAVECLKHPLCQKSDGLREAVGGLCGLQEAGSRSLWDVVCWLETHESWLPLREPSPPAETMMKRLMHLTEHGAPLPPPRSLQ